MFSLTDLLGLLHVEFRTQDEYHVADVTLKLVDGIQATGISRSKPRALGYALRDIANRLIEG